MLSQDGFPVALLKQPIQERVAYFKNYTMAHPKLLEAAQKLMQTLNEPAGVSLLFLFGPTGVGKSTLLRRTSQKLIEAALPALEKDRGRIPIAGIEAATPEFSHFDWKDFYLRALKAIEEPFLDIPARRITNFQLRMELENALRQRQLTVFYIDEAQNLGKVASGRKLRDQADCIKSLANLTRVQFILAGTYELLILRNLSAQLCRRSIDIHFSRYLANQADDLRAFQGVVQTFQRHLPLPEQPDLLENWDYCYERSIGCVGILKDWLSRTLAAALSDGATTLTRKHLERHAWSREQCTIVLAEAKEGEDRLESHTTSTTLRVALGLEVATDESSKIAVAPAGKRQRKAVGQPLPQRRPVGDGQHVS